MCCADQSLAILSILAILATLATPPRDFPISNISANQFLWPIWAELLGHAQPAELCSEAVRPPRAEVALLQHTTDLIVLRVTCDAPYSSLLRCHLSWVLVIILVIQASLISAHEEANLRNCRRSTNDFVVSLIMLFGRIFVKTLQMLMIILRSNLDSFVV